MTEKEIKSLLVMIAEHEVYDDLYWRRDLTFYVRCNDLFAWATGDSEPLTPDLFESFDKACKEADFYGPLLFCARRRGMRPQGAYYKSIPEEYHALFDACGEARPAGPGNPVNRGASLKNTSSLATNPC